MSTMSHTGVAEGSRVWAEDTDGHEREELDSTWGLTSSTHTLPEATTPRMESMRVPYRLPSYSPCSR